MTFGVEDIARVTHEINRAYCEALGDHSQPTWERAPDWQRESAIDGVRFLLGHVANGGVAPGPEASHARWAAVKLRDGWRYGPEKDPQRKLHPCLVPFAELPIEQRAKDYLFRAVVLALAGALATPPFPDPEDAAHGTDKSSAHR